MSTATETLNRMPILRQRLNEAQVAANPNPVKFTVWRFKDGFINYTAHYLPLKSHVDFEILGEFDNKLEALEFIVSKLLYISGVGAAL